MTFCDVALQPRAEVKNLGVVFDSTLSWESHVSELSRQCTGVLIGLSHCRHYLPDGVIKVLVSALVLTRIRYCLAVYGNGTQKNFDRLQRVLNSTSSLAGVSLIMCQISVSSSVGCRPNRCRRHRR